MNDSPDLQRTPQYTQPRRDIPIPESDVLDPVAEYNRGEVQALDDTENNGFAYAIERSYFLIDIDQEKNYSKDYIQGYFDAVETLAQQEI
jgi:hypothetical protein